MKIKILLTAVLLSYSATCLGQDLKIKGVLIKGSSNELIQKFQNKYPYDIQYQDKNGIVLSGNYLNKPVLYIIHFSKEEQIKSVDIKFPQCYNWESLESNYNEIKTKLINQYGQPVYKEEYFKDFPAKIHYYTYTVNNKCMYSSEFKDNKSNTYIRLFIKTFSDKTTSVVVRHTNGEWSNQKFKSIMYDLEEAEIVRHSGIDIESSMLNNSNQKSISNANGYGTFDLKGRSLSSGGLPIPEYNVQDEGRVVVNIVVNHMGRVVSTSINKRTNTVNPKLRKAAEEAARRAHFNATDECNNQTGTITYYFKLK